MDITLAKTFLEIVETGSFAAAASRLNVTQTSVSARIHVLEEQLGRRLFVRNKSGARLTAAGERFLRHATTLVQVWDRARREVGLPQGRRDIASIGAEISLWNPLLVDWLIWMKQEAPDIAIRAEVDVPSRLMDAVHDGALDLAVLYDPPRQAFPGLVVELLHEEKLILVSTGSTGKTGFPQDYVSIDWGPGFQASLAAAFPSYTDAAVSISHGPLALLYILNVSGTGYFRVSAARPYLESGQLSRVANAPEFSYSVHMVYSSRLDTGLVDTMRRGLSMSIPGEA